MAEDIDDRPHMSINTVFTSETEHVEMFVATENGKAYALFPIRVQPGVQLAVHVRASKATEWRRLLEKMVEEARHFEAKAQALAGPW